MTILEDHMHVHIIISYLLIQNCENTQVMLIGHKDNNLEDKIMKVTIVYNHFGPGLVQRMPRYIYRT